MLEKIADLCKSTSIRLLATDMDGTLLDSGSKVPPENLKCLEVLREHGVETVLCSGRNIGMMRNFCADLPVSQIVVACNGGLIYDCKNDVALHFAEIDKESVFAFADRMFEQKADFMVYRADGAIFYPSYSARVDSFRRYNEQMLADGRTAVPLFEIERSVEEFGKGNFAKMLVKSHPGDDFHAVRDFVSTLGHIDSAMSFAGLLDIMHENATKGFGLRFVAKHLGARCEDAIAIGDERNDISMFQATPNSACMKNGADEAKSHAAFVTSKDNDNGGFVEAVAHFLSLNKS